ncbi:MULTISPECIES: amino acid ABC transporter substrate-binding protein [Bradyrhizobium]|jgi:general L-amino acid transport system substrate-binding protein|uniref:amino acid ABC transporter substrate-binding protein n=1 Tax=Bradyrhizobium TaxID=374 RepID=UPI000487AB33|nr:MULTISPECIES: amino acid ABC transporter substrate-binding protein [Bradyrhizobium]MCS3453466.1 general L-amino acid transport system substrate-binding protein [Bradyrhizobium elkanii]MCS3564426.1 general L-amino acid transport system substrate-binding protein [Bradyrhizobium elkanii]MCW2145742.1 general L-amino acid transport system substrate-binding protein [Bradyrhizobium elkanii]MCW2355189.1 general L-amino acid transport system substrate-binding protein [Bradyrhizobium elkanii]MCW23785
MRTFRGGLTIGLAIAALVAAAAITYERYDTRTLKRTVRRGDVLCGVNKGLPGFSIPDDKGNWTGFDVDFCRAVASAIFDDPSKAKFLPLDASERFKELQNRKVDILSRNSTWSMSRETNYDLYFPAVAYYDGQGFMLPRSRNIDSALDLNGSKVCVQANTTTQLNLADYFRANNMKYTEMKFDKLDDVVKAYSSGQCDTLTSDASQLYALRLNLAKPSDHTILADIISKEPLAPVVRLRDDDWMMIVKWTLYAMINAEELGITSKNIDEALKSKKPEVMRLVGTEGSYGEDLGLTKDWAVRIIRHVGNYGEVYDRNVGADSKLKIPRGMNQLWNAGGVQYAPPIR